MFLMLFENTLYLWCKKYINLENIKYSTIITKTYRKSKKNNPFLITLIARQKSFFFVYVILPTFHNSCHKQV